jgi:hypothetical protein
MNKRTIALIIVLILAGIGFYLGLSYQQSLKTTDFQIHQPATGVAIYKTGKQDANSKVASLSGSGQVKLPKGSYTAVPSGKNVNDNPIDFTVGDNNPTINVDPGYSTAYLDKLLVGQQATINQVIRSTYPSVIGAFKVNNGKLYTTGEWYAATLVQNPPHPKTNGDVYRLVLRKENDTWKIVASPQLVLTTSNSPGVPIEVLRDVNTQSGY